tara:strand:- start:1539 stop:3290 length:1752 start_codon:yes stop_codon:yes gene_type:complete
MFSVLNLLLIFTFNLVFNNFLIDHLLNKNTDIAKYVLENVQDDLIKISFPLNFQLNSFFFAFIVSLLMTALTKVYVVNNFSTENAVKIISTISKLFFIYTGSIFSILYFLRLFQLSRGVFILAMAVYPILSYLIILFTQLGAFQNIQRSFLIKSVPFAVLLFLFGSFYFQRANQNDSVSIDAISTTTTTTTVPLFLASNQENCFEWSGSDNFTECIPGATVITSEKYSQSVNNIIINKEDIYILDVFGRVFKNNPETIFIDVSSETINRIDKGEKDESGLFSMVFHPNDNYFLISFSDKDRNLVVKKYNLDIDGNPELESSEVIVKIPNPIDIHYSGSLIWSEYFEDFLLGVGDMQLKANSKFSSEPLDTTSPRGKILFVNKKISEPDLLALYETASPRNDILAYGLRNPWKSSEYKNYLFVPDVGEAADEELNIVDLNEFNKTKKPYLFGWPHYEGNIDREIKFNEIFLFGNSEYSNINDYVKANSVRPLVHYSHVAPQNFRAAIIGGGVIADTTSKYFENYIFTDFLSSEIFAYDFLNNKLKTIPLGNLGHRFHTLDIHPTKKDTVLLTTRSGYLFEVKLP